MLQTRSQPPLTSEIAWLPTRRRSLYRKGMHLSLPFGAFFLTTMMQPKDWTTGQARISASFWRRRDGKAPAAVNSDVQGEGGVWGYLDRMVNELEAEYRVHPAQIMQWKKIAEE